MNLYKKLKDLSYQADMKRQLCCMRKWGCGKKLGKQEEMLKLAILYLQMLTLQR